MTIVLVTGGTGLLGAHVARHLTSAGYTVRILRRGAVPKPPAGLQAVSGDLRTGRGLDDAVAGTTAIVHCASNPRAPQQVDVEGTRRLLAAAKRCGDPHLVYISIVGVDRIPWSYYRAKLAAEHAIEQSGTPWTVLRATQFHDFAVDLVRRVTRLPVALVPRGWRVQPIDVRDVAAGLVSAVAAGPAGRLPDLGGPQILSMADLARSYLQAAGRRRRVIEVPVPGRFSATLRAGANLVPDNHASGRTWHQFLTDQAATPLDRPNPHVTS